MGLSAEALLVIAGAVFTAVLVASFALRLPVGEAMFERSLRPRVTTETWPSQLVRIEHILGWAGTNAADVHARLRPILVEVAVARLARRGLRLDAHAAEAERLLGPQTWELVRPDRPPPPDPDAPGIPPRELTAVLDALEAV